MDRAGIAVVCINGVLHSGLLFSFLVDAMGTKILEGERSRELCVGRSGRLSNRAVACAYGTTLTTAVLGFLVFRIFDIIKLPGARYIDRNWHGAWGILLDDIVSGLYAAGLVWIVVQWCT